ncbi:MAG TPA: hypothetical protein DCM27_03340 [Rhodospirillaceae bacterium]|nr:hypothetical protein [Rhodospirillaceae bacterium]
MRWVENAPFEGNSSADYKESPKTYAIELNSDEDIAFITNFDRAIKCALHEQTHVKQSNSAHSFMLAHCLLLLMMLPDILSGNLMLMFRHGVLTV